MNKRFKKDDKQKSDKREFIRALGTAIIIAIFLKTFIFNVTYVKGDSMNPTLEEGDRLLLKKYETVLKIEKYNHGDIIVFESPLEKDQDLFIKKSFIKRVIGVSGDKINILGGEVFVNDKFIDEVYIENDSFTEALYYGEDYIISEEEIFVIGDNREPGASNDSRSFGSISLESIKGKVVFRIFPFNKMGTNLK